MNICRQVRLYYVGRRAITGFEGQRISIFGLRIASRDVATAQGNVGPAPGQARQGRLVTKASTEAAPTSRSREATNQREAATQ